MELQQHRIEVLLEAEQPVKHLAESLGNSAYLNARLVRQPTGGFARVPEVSGDTMRHGLRAAAAAFALRRAFPDGKVELTEAAVRLLFAGGMVTGNGDSKSIKFGEYRKMVELLPHLGLLGGCAQNRTIPGRVDVDPATLVCAETAHAMPAWALAACEEEYGAPHRETFRAYVEEVQRVRMDPMLVPTLRGMLSPDDADRIDRQLEASERASADGNDAARLASKSAMMPRRYERLVQGSVFYWSVGVTLATELDEDVFYTMFCAFAADMVVGGGRATGHGRLKILRLNRAVVRGPGELPVAGAPEAVGLSSLRPRVGELLGAHLDERAEKVREFLRAVDA